MNNVDFSIKNIFENEVERKDNFYTTPILEKEKEKGQTIFNKIDNDDENIFSYTSKPNHIREYFDFIFSKNQMNISKNLFICLI